MNKHKLNKVLLQYLEYLSHKNQSKTFDVILVDYCNPYSPTIKLFNFKLNRILYLEFKAIGLGRHQIQVRLSSGEYIAILPPDNSDIFKLVTLLLQ